MIFNEFSLKFYALLLAGMGCSSVFGQNTRQIENQKAFAKVYGYVKYFHPSQEAYELDWDKFAIYGAKEVNQCKNNDELVATLDRLFGPIAPSVHFYKGENHQEHSIRSLTPADTSQYELTYWQHLGVSFGMNTGYYTPYQSVRVNSLNEIELSNRSGRLLMSVDAQPYGGKSIRFTANAKIKDRHEGEENEYLRLVIYKADGTADLGKTTITTTKWQQYEVLKSVDSTATRLTIGAANKGKGSVLIDEVRLHYQEGGKWLEVPLQNNGFEHGSLAQNKESDQWRGEGEGYQYSISTEDYFEGEKSAQIKFISPTSRGKAIFNERPSGSELIIEELIDSVFCKVPLVLYTSKMQTYPPINQKELAQLKYKLAEVSNSPTMLEVRLGNLISVYNVFQHFYPYLDVVDVNWDKELEKALKRSFSDSSGDDHHITLQKFTAPLRDGHILVDYKRFTGLFTPRITWEWIENKLIITNVLDEKLPLAVGDEVTLIEGQNPSEYFKEIYSRISAGTTGWLNFRANTISLYGDHGSKMTITVNGSDVEMERSGLQYNEAARSAMYEKINEDVYYLNITSIEMEDIERLLPELVKTKSIICDLRGYPNRNHGLINYLLKENDTSENWMQIPKILRPNEILGFENTNWMLKKKEPYLGDKQIIFLIDGRAISYAESFMGFIDGYDLATIVGQPTAGTNGNINSFDLPGGYTIRWTGMKVVKHDGSQLHRIGILPDIYVNKTIEGVKAGRDEFLERAIELTKD